MQLRLKRSRTEKQPQYPGENGGGWQVLVLGAVLGLIMGATSIGAGTLMTAPVLLLYRISADKVVGTTIGVSLVLMIVGTLGYLSQDLVKWSTVLFMSLGAVPAVIVGSRPDYQGPRAGLDSGAYGNDADGVSEFAREGGVGVLRGKPVDTRLQAQYVFPTPIVSRSTE